MIKVIISYIITVIKVISVVIAGEVSPSPVDNGVIDVTVNPMNGSAAYSFVAEEGSLLEEPETPENRGLIFNGWYNGKEEWDFSSDTVSEDITLSAKWKFSESFCLNDPNAGVRAENSDIRVMSFNVLASDWNNHPPTEGRDDLLRDVVSRYAPDVIGMQEVNGEWYDSLKNEFGPYRFVNEKNNKIRGHINYSTIAYNTETVTLLKYGQKAFTVNMNENCRNLMWALFECKDDPSKRFMVTSTHFDLTSQRRVAEAVEMTGILKILEYVYKVPMFCTGDYNMREPSDEYYTFTRCSGFKSSKYAAAERGLVASSSHLGDGTGSADDLTSGYWKLGPESYKQKEINTIYTIDHIFASPDADILYYDTVVDEAALTASDHCPIYVDVDLDKTVAAE